MSISGWAAPPTGEPRDGIRRCVCVCLCEGLNLSVFLFLSLFPSAHIQFGMVEGKKASNGFEYYRPYAKSGGPSDVCLFFGSYFLWFPDVVLSPVADLQDNGRSRDQARVVQCVNQQYGYRKIEWQLTAILSAETEALLVDLGRRPTNISAFPGTRFLEHRV